jgi:hypothetical protein
MYGKMNHDDTNDAIGKFIFANGIPFHVSHSPYYKEMVCAIVASGPSYVPLGEHKLKTFLILQKEQMGKASVQYYMSKGVNKSSQNFPFVEERAY